MVALLALFLALGGGALAATGWVGSDGRIRSCVGPAGGMTLIKPGQGCASGKHLVAWNQTGPRGPGAFQFSRHLEFGEDNWFPSAAGVDGLRTTLVCSPVGSGFWIQISSVNSSDEVQVSGMEVANDTFKRVNASGYWAPQFGGTPDKPVTNDNLTVIARNTRVWKWVKFDLGGYTDGQACNFWGMITPPSN